MASQKPSLVIGQENTLDPFVTTGGPTAPTNLRFSGFDGDSFALGPGASPTSAKRALEAHLADTERRMEEAGKLGTALVQQRKELTDRLKEVEQLEAEDELSPELKLKLTAIEKDFNEVARESARAFLPKHRVPSGEANPGTPFTPSKDVVRRSMSPSKFDNHKFESLATGSPSKFSVPNRKARNQPANRIHDIEFAAEISTSLITQVRNLQALLQERDEEVKDLKSEKSGLEVEVQGFQQRMRNLDESESRYKDENWSLETQIQEFIAGQKEAADREKKLSHALNALQADKNATQRELDEIRAAHSKLAEDHAAAVKHHDIELGTAKRNAIMAEGERAALQRKIDELTSQNQELAKAISGERGRTSQRNSPSGSSEDDLENASGNLTPEHSPPPSPIKPTPRHAMLETETLKTSLQHAQRTIQSLRTNVHREKTEKLELKRMLQESRDEIEKLRSDPVERPHQKRAREAKSREFKKPAKLDKLGTARAIKAEIFEDPEWEDASVRGPPLMLARMTGQADIPIPSTESDEFETANEAHESTDAFETAHERGGTETEEAFQTGAEDLDSDDTEIESPSRRAGAARASGALKKAPIFASPGPAYTYESTASTSASEDEDYTDPTRTPNSQPRRVRMRANHGPSSSSRRFSRQLSEEPGFQGSPASMISQTNRSFSSTQGLPRQSLFAELGELEGSDEDSTVGTPGQRSLRSVTPASTARGMTASPRSVVPPVPAMPKIIMVDSGMMTEPVDPQSVAAAALSPQRPMSMDSVVFSSMRDGSPSASPDRDTGAEYADSETEENLTQPLSPFKSPTVVGGMPTPILAPPQQLTVSDVHTQEVEPQAEPEPAPALPPRLGLSSVFSEHVEPVAEAEVPPPALSMSRVVAEGIDPVAEPEVPPPPAPTLSVSSLVAEHVEPVAEPLPPPPTLVFSQVSSAETEPVAEPEPEPRVVTVVEYREAPKPPPADLALSPIYSAETEPVSEPEPEPRVVTVVEYREAPLPPPAVLDFSPISSAETEPVAEPEAEPRVVTVVEYRDQPTPPPAELTFTTISSAEVEPVAEPAPEPQVVRVVEYVEAPQPPPAELSLSAVSSTDVEPVAQPEPEPRVVHVVEYVEAPPPPPAQLSYSGLISEGIEPREVPQPLSPTLTVSPIVVEDVEPKPEAAPLPPPLSVSQVLSEQVEPVSPVTPVLERQIPSPLNFSTIQSLETHPEEPESPVFSKPLLSALGLSAVESLATDATSPASPKRNAFIIPRDEEERPVTPTKWGVYSSTSPRKAKDADAVVIAEDETRQSLNASPSSETPESLQPFKEISANASAKPARKMPVQTSDSGAQTSLTAEAIDEMFQVKNSQPQSPVLYRSDSLASADGMSSPGTVRVGRSHESMVGGAHRFKGRMIDMSAETAAEAALRRPGSAASARSPTKSLPPLPPNHREVIEAARTGTANSGHGTIGSMGPPLFPASAYKNAMNRPRTPMSTSSRHGDSAARPERPGTADVHSPTRLTAKSRKSSVSSFASEVDHRFNMAGGMMGMQGSGFGPNTDPRMIQAITQTMIGEYLWKYTRKTGRGEMSENRHRRYFWVHPYTRTLYWSDRDPTNAGRAELRAKSVPIEAVRVVTDDNPMPPGLHRKSLVIIAPGRSVKFTCTTGQRHETWFNALSYLLLRTDGEGHADTEEMVNGITREDVEEFNPSLDRRNTAGTGARGAPSISSYNSRGTRQEAVSVNLDVPTLTPNHKKAVSTSGVRPSLAGRLSGYWRSTQDSLSLRGRSGYKDQHSLYSNNEVHDSAEDLREMYEKQDRESDRLENVRACCDGKSPKITPTSSF
ncbi:putative nuclear migration protein [Cryphonectria parasitica EP155]|uniref:Nuclear migration protein n=1 Tax=Cryphonectria parasitica (strain ATCC 38755 / EP155) TaxID=660469 RepID=A0A9P5CJU4_CRYP1|nr:putative nuclear migration protein [Cryphonectria parasitica EP155]KAF3760085.1 putative nuclear migration protein [Cryphonectria parasitica EP155]